MNDSTGVVLTEETDIIARWRSYFQKLMNVENERVDRTWRQGQKQIWR